MDKKRLSKLLHEERINEIYYEDRPVWIQEIHDTKAKVGFLDGSKEKDVYIKDLYE